MERLWLSLVVAVAVVGCVPERAEPTIYTCTILYRCVGDETISTALALPCAEDREEAHMLATDIGMEAVAARCPNSWQYVRPMCERYEPVTTCE